MTENTITAKDGRDSNLPHNLEIRLKAVYASLKSAERKAADFLVRDPEATGRMTITELSAAAGCSEATISRFVKKLGSESFAQFKEELSSDIPRKAVDVFDSYGSDDTPSEILEKTFHISIMALHDTLDSIDINEFNEAAQALKSAQKIAAFGAGDAAAAASIVYSKFLRIGREVYMASDTDGMNIICSQMKPCDVIICISHSGATKNVVGIAKQAKKRGIKVIAITNYPLSKLAKNADFVLFTASFTEGINGEIISKRLPEMCIVESLFLVLLLSDAKYRDALLEANESVLCNKF